jgi:hypothetical protein
MTHKQTGNSLLVWGCILLFTGGVILIAANAKKKSNSADDQKNAKNLFIAGGVLAGVGAVCVGGGVYLKQKPEDMMLIPAQQYQAYQDEM